MAGRTTLSTSTLMVSGTPATLQRGTPAVHYEAVTSSETWFLDWYDVGPLTDVHTLTFMATGAAGTYWFHYGQVGIEEIATAMADSCDDGNACTDDTCGSYGICEYSNNTASCDDGLYCNGVDTCADGSCSHSGDPCLASETCNEDSDTCELPGAPLILNEYNAVGSSKWLDCDGLECSDAEDVHFGRVEGNGGNWIELVVTQDNLDMRGWSIEWVEDTDSGTITFTDDDLWDGVRAGTIITLTEQCISEGGLDTSTSFNPVTDWWININTLCGGVAQETYVTTTHSSAPNGSFSVGNDDFQLTILDETDAVVFGPAGEGICDFDGVGSREVGKLEEDPSPSVTACSDYNDGTSSSFGHPNLWSDGENRQRFNDLRGEIIDIELVALSAPSTCDTVGFDVCQGLNFGTPCTDDDDCTDIPGIPGSGVCVPGLLELPTSDGQFNVGATFYLEMWAQTTHASGLSAVFTDIDYDPCVVTAEEIFHTGAFYVSGLEGEGGTIDNANGVIDNVGGPHLDSLCATGFGVAPNWVRVAYIEFTADAHGTPLFTSRNTNSSYDNAICGTLGVTDQDRVSYGELAVQAGAESGDLVLSVPAAPQIIGVGQQVTVDLNVANLSTAVTGVQALMHYNTQNLSLAGAALALPWDIEISVLYGVCVGGDNDGAQCGFSGGLDCSVGGGLCAETGDVLFSAGISGGASTDVDGTVATFTFNAVEDSSPVVSFLEDLPAAYPSICTKLTEATTAEFISPSRTDTTDGDIQILDGECYIEGEYYDDGDPNPLNECEVCDTATSLSTWTPAASGSSCGATPGECENQDTCDGAGNCVDNGFVVSGTECRAAADECDVAEYCTGSDADCPADAFETAGTSCGAVPDDCENQDTCDGAGLCVDQGFKAAGTECRSAAGVCDVAEVCDGLSAACPADEFETAGTECRPAVDDCDVAETCTGSEADCPVDGFEPDGTSCDLDGLFCTGDTCQTGVCTAGGDPCSGGELCNEAEDVCCPGNEYGLPDAEMMDSGFGDLGWVAASSLDSKTLIDPGVEFAITLGSTSGDKIGIGDDYPVGALAGFDLDDDPSDPDALGEQTSLAAYEAYQMVVTYVSGPADSDIDFKLHLNTGLTGGSGYPSGDWTNDTYWGGTWIGLSVGQSAIAIHDFESAEAWNIGDNEVPHTGGGLGWTDGGLYAINSRDRNEITNIGFEVNDFDDDARSGQIVIRLEMRLSGCLIDDVCYDEGELNPLNDCEFCDPQTSTTSWTPVVAGTLCGATPDVCENQDTCDGAGTCTDNGYKTTLCRDAVGDCDVAEYCDGSSPACPADVVAGVGIECRAQIGDCDVAEVCDGVSTECPVDEVAGSGTECRAATGLCDAVETCDGVSVDCPADEVAANGTECRAATGLCDVAEVCDGVSGVCPDDEVAANGTECRAVVGDCDVAEVCDGASVDCPTDEFAASGTECREATGLCDVTEVCDGSSALCPADEVAMGGTECRAASGDCDVAEVCDGISGDCPEDGYEAAGTECRAATDLCDAAEVCDGMSADCPTDEFAASGTECRAATGLCDVAEVCDGSSTACPADVVAAADTECRAPAGDCDVAEVCDGLSAFCPADEVASSGTECRAATGDCDVAEACDGISADCPADVFVASGTECRAATGVCDVAEVCDGMSADCPTDEVATSGTECRAAAGDCDVAEVCDGMSGACPADGYEVAGTECRAATDLCDVAEVCDGASAGCPADAVAAAGTVCRSAAGDCDVAEACDGLSVTCPVDEYEDASTVCRPSAGVCDPAEYCPGDGPDCPDDVDDISQIDVTIEIDALTNEVSRDVTFVLTDCEGATETRVEEVLFAGGGPGTVSLYNVDTETDWIQVKEGHTLSALLPVSFEAPDYCYANVEFTGDEKLLSGDFSNAWVAQDNLVDIQDFAILSIEWNSLVDPDLGTLADANGDGIQDGFDFAPIQANFALTGDAESECVLAVRKDVSGGRSHFITSTGSQVRGGSVAASGGVASSSRTSADVNGKGSGNEANYVQGSGTVRVDPGSGRVNRRAVRTRVSVAELAVPNAELADMNGDGVVNASDIRAFANVHGLVLTPQFSARLSQFETNELNGESDSQHE